ncbi:uncharacterized protein LOC119285943 [Triticum dicoccoides]|uniref:uncharacterized protein LOC119285943 n=1 Tax=Triticum dicoccoides TaxID=85692 RepID=UPI00188EBB73|nr:uncharacterized protein LOC119285943 [Triticum dicoccoides]XP_044363777.1 uncharacterized protein LOC123086134 [Triticum aestivum]
MARRPYHWRRSPRARPTPRTTSSISYFLPNVQHSPPSSLASGMENPPLRLSASPRPLAGAAGGTQHPPPCHCNFQPRRPSPSLDSAAICTAARQLFGQLTQQTGGACELQGNIENTKASMFELWAQARGSTSRLPQHLRRLSNSTFIHGGCGLVLSFLAYRCASSFRHRVAVHQ